MSHKNALDITGQTFNYLLAIEKTELKQGGHIIWKFLCVCGKEHLAVASDVKRGTTKSCGCKQSEMISEIQTTHGATKRYKPTRTYMVWGSMKKRCNNPNTKHYEDYGGRGITVCERWNSFENFLADMGDAPPGMSIDRIDNNGNYEPGNCRWADDVEQGRNRRSTIYLEIDGIRRCLADWARIGGVHYRTVQRRLLQGMSAREAVFTPPMPRNLRNAKIAKLA